MLRKYVLAHSVIIGKVKDASVIFDQSPHLLIVIGTLGDLIDKLGIHIIIDIA